MFENGSRHLCDPSKPAVQGCLRYSKQQKRQGGQLEFLGNNVAEMGSLPDVRAVYGEGASLLLTDN